MSGITALAKHIRKRDNPAVYSPIFGKIILLPNLTIRLGDRILLDAVDVKATFDLYETRIHDGRTEYIQLNKEAVSLPYGRNIASPKILFPHLLCGISPKGERGMSSEYNASLLSYRTAMSLAKGMLSCEIISEEEYRKIDKITAADTPPC